MRTAFCKERNIFHLECAVSENALHAKQFALKFHSTLLFACYPGKRHHEEFVLLPCFPVIRQFRPDQIVSAGNFVKLAAGIRGSYGPTDIINQPPFKETARELDCFEAHCGCLVVKVAVFLPHVVQHEQRENLDMVLFQEPAGFLDIRD